MKRILLFIVTNILFIITISIIFYIISSLTGITISGDYTNSSYLGLFIFSAVVGSISAIFSLLSSKWMVKRLYNIQILDLKNRYNFTDKENIIVDTVERISNLERIDIPEIGIYIDDEPNAFATGPTKNNSLVCVSSGLLKSMNKSELEGVIAHEMSHVVSGDMVTMTLISGVINTLVIFISRILATLIAQRVTDSENGYQWIQLIISIILEIILGILAGIIVMWFSRQREYSADKGAANYVGKEKIIAGLKVLQNISYNDKKDILTTAKINSNSLEGILQLWASHPKIEDRIAKLEKLY